MFKPLNKAVKRNVFWYAFLVAWGLLLGQVLVGPYMGVSGSEKAMLDEGYIYMSSRWQFLSECIRTASQGQVPFITQSHDHSLGLFLYGAYLGKWLGMQEGYEVLAFMQMNMAVILHAAMPVFMYFVTRLKSLALLTPLMIHLFLGRMLYIEKTDVHWGAVWCIVLGIPLAFYLMNRIWDKYSFCVFALICLIMSVGNIIRSQAPLTVLLILIPVIIYKLLIEDRWKKRNYLFVIAAFFIIFLTYNLLGETIPEWICVRNGQEPGKTASTVWHNVLIGFGAVDNPYGLYYSDDCAGAIVRELRPDVVYGSVEYFDICKKLVFDLIRKDPLFCIGSYFKKFLLTCKEIFLYYRTNGYAAGIMVLSFIMLLAGKKEIKKTVIGKYKYLIIFCVFSIFAGMAQPILTYPSYGYAYPALAGIGMTFLTLSVLFFEYAYEMMSGERGRKRCEKKI